MSTEIFGWVCGRRVSLTDPRPQDTATVTGAAVALAYSHRFNGSMGQCSLAAHSVRVADSLPPQYRLAGLVHDLGEIVTGDIPSPLKPLCPGIVEIEHTWRRRLLTQWLGLEDGTRLDAECEHPLVKEMDAADYFGELEHNLANLRKLQERLVDGEIFDRRGPSPLREASTWINRFRELSGVPL